MIGLYQRIGTIKNLRTGKDLSIMVNFACRYSGRRKRQSMYAQIMQDLPSLMEIIGKESQQYPSSTTRINAVIIQP